MVSRPQQWVLSLVLVWSLAGEPYSTVVGRRTFPKTILLLMTVALLIKFKKLPELYIVLGAAVIGLVIYPMVRF